MSLAVLILLAAAASKPAVVYSPGDGKALPSLVGALPVPSEVSDAPILPAKVEAGGDKGEEHETATVSEKPMMLETAKPPKKPKKKKEPK